MKFDFLLVLIFLLNGAMGQVKEPCASCLPQGITFNEQQAIDHFSLNYPGCTQIEGDVVISGNDITNLNGLSVLTSIGGRFTVAGNPLLVSLAGLNNVTNMGGANRGGIFIEENIALSSLNGLEGLTVIDWAIHLSQNQNLSSLTGLDNVTSVTGLLIEENPSLTDLSGLGNLNNIEYSLTIRENESLNNFAGLENLTALGDLRITGNASLTDFSGLDYLESIVIDLEIRDNPSLISLAGLYNLEYIGNELIIMGNPVLNSLSAMINLTYVEYISIHGNAVLPSLTGLDYIDARYIERIFITGNQQLSDCAVISICDYLMLYFNETQIENNATGCNNEPEVRLECINLSADTPVPGDHFSIIYDLVSSGITIEFPSCTATNSSMLKIVDISGKQLLHRQITAPTTTIDISTLSSGIYVVKVVGENGVQVGKFLKQ